MYVLLESIKHNWNKNKNKFDACVLCFYLFKIEVTLSAIFTAFLVVFRGAILFGGNSINMNSSTSNEQFCVANAFSEMKESVFLPVFLNVRDSPHTQYSAEI